MNGAIPPAETIKSISEISKRPEAPSQTPVSSEEKFSLTSTRMRIYDLRPLLRLLLCVGRNHRLVKVCEGMGRPLQLKENTFLCMFLYGTHVL
ncbi:hypothetical protein QQF64_001990 [Cirrhinus molitorella]|uniref:Uncharacterized protein n=1 Tax=Cirrhinus molitorella TaxID=172907 RepID=A0ABR3MNV7_9TELE